MGNCFPLFNSHQLCYARYKLHVLCKIQVQDGIKPTVLMSVLVKDEMLWAVTILNTTNNGNCEIPLELSDEEIQALRYTAGYIPRSLKKKILKSSRDPEQQQDLVLCLDDLLSDGTEEPSESEEWLTALNRGGLLCVNNMTFELFYSMELEFRRHIGAEGINSDTAEMMEKNENVLFCWCIISASWEEECSSILLPMIIQLRITIRGYSLVQISSKKTVQKSKSLRKELAKD